MGRYTGPSCKMCRREGRKLFLKGERCYMAKCPIETGRPRPGGEGQRRRKMSDYAEQLRTKQSLRRAYGLRESQFRLFFERAARGSGVTGEKLLQSLEMRLDNTVYRLGLAASRKAARQFVLHGHVAVNGRRATIPSMILSAGDVVQVREKDRDRQDLQHNIESVESRGMAPWLTLEKNQMKGEVLHVPTRREIEPEVNEQLIVELYSK